MQKAGCNLNYFFKNSVAKNRIAQYLLLRIF
jgi:hypothetical protein